MKRSALIAGAALASLVFAACTGGTPSSSAPTVGATGTAVPSLTASARPRATLPPPPTALPQALKVQGAQPQGLLFADGSIWVAEAGSGNVVRLDPGSGKVQATFRGLGDGLESPFVGGSRVWVPSTHALVGIDPTTNKVVLTVKGTYSMTGTVANGHVWIGDGRDRLLELDASSGKTIQRVSVGGQGEQVGETCSNSVTSGAGVLWWSVNDTGSIVRVDPSTGQKTGTASNVGATAVAVVDGTPWAVSNDGNVLELDPTSGGVSTSSNFLYALPDICAGPMVADGPTLWFLDGRSSCGCGTGSSPIYRFDTTSRMITGSYDPGDVGTQSMAVANHALWLDFSGSGVVARYDPPFP